MYYVLFCGGYSTEHDTLKQALDEVDNYRDDQDYEVTKVTEKVVARRGNP